MPDWSRRCVLHAAASAAALSLAGCNGAPPGEPPGDAPPNGELVTDYEVRKVRNAEGAILLSPTDEETRTDVESEARRRALRVNQHLHVTDEEELADVAFETDYPEATVLEEFTHGTDLETESVFLLQQAVPECKSLRLGDVRRDPDSLHVDTCEDLRPADVECAEDERDVVALAIRLPFPGDDFHGLGVGGGSSCDDRPTAFDPSAYNGSDTGDGNGGESA